jgi:hypothetical protein
MNGPTHLGTASYRMLADSIVRKVLAVQSGKRRSDRDSSLSKDSKRGKSDTGYRSGSRSGPAN